MTTAIRDATELDTLSGVGPAVDRRYGIERRIHTDTGHLAVRASRHPQGESDGFTDALHDQHARWASVSHLEGVVSVVERGVADAPWLVTADTGSAIEERPDVSPSRALEETARLADVLADLHERGIVHAGIEPGNVVFPPGGADRAAFHNVGLVDVYRRYEDPATVLDPRYAAPEYFGSDRGIVDRTTDVYGLGVVCFRLVTGVAPFAGTAAAIAERVTDEDPLPAPSRVEPGLPTAIDEVIRTATATDKFDRYETAGAFRDALEAAIDA